MEVFGYLGGDEAEACAGGMDVVLLVDVLQVGLAVGKEGVLVDID